MLSLKDVAAWLSALCTRAPKQRDRFSDRSKLIRDSNIREAARVVAELSASGSLINLGQGLPEYPAPTVLKDAAKAAIDADFNQYSDTRGYAVLRQAIAAKLQRYNGIKANPDTEVTVTCGASEALHIALQALVNPGDEVIIIEPFYENYHPDVVMAGGVPRYVRLHAPDYTFDKQELEAAFNKRTRAILLTNPHNPTGRVFTREELKLIADLCVKWDVVCISDEIYEHLVYDGRKHISIATLPGMEDRTITVTGLSKTFGVTGWRLGYFHAAAPLTKQIRKLHDYVTLAAPSPLQIAAVTALNLPDSFYDEMVQKYQAARDELAKAAAEAGLKFRLPEGAYYLYTDSSELGFANDKAAWEFLLREHKLVSVAGYCFYRPGTATNNLRFCFAKRPETIEAGAAVLKAAAKGLKPK
jgi:L-glutamine---4-(methylsulfanyl)-2-oxobutanoate aminotransferase